MLIIDGSHSIVILIVVRERTYLYTVRNYFVTEKSRGHVLHRHVNGRSKPTDIRSVITHNVSSVRLCFVYPRTG